jgi:hypothetical protein
MKLKDETDAFIPKFGLGGLGELKEILSLKVPLVGRSSNPRICSMVLFPAPDAPTTAISSPRAMVRSMPFSTGRVCSPMENDL